MELSFQYNASPAWYKYCMCIPLVIFGQVSVDGVLFSNDVCTDAELQCRKSLKRAGRTSLKM
jgi:hypothetical protein